MNYFMIMVILLLAPSHKLVSVKVAQKALNTSVLLRIKSSKGMAGCSGTYISPTKILTAAHCFSDDEIKSVWARGMKESVGYPVKLLVKDPSHDLALLEAPFKRPYARFGEAPRRGEYVLNVGSPLMFEFVVSEGTVGAVNFTTRGFKSHYTVTTAMINPGSSGGGAFNSRGELIGVNTMSIGIFGWSGISLAVSMEDIENFLEKA